MFDYNDDDEDGTDDDDDDTNYEGAYLHSTGGLLARSSPPLSSVLT